MSRNAASTWVCAVLLAATAGCRTNAAGTSATEAASQPAANETAATVNGESIPVSAVDSKVADKLYELRRGALEAVISDRLVAAEAKARGLSPESLLQAEVDAKVPQIPPADLEATYEDNKFRFGDQPKADVMTQIETVLRRRARAQVEQQYRQSLRDKAKVQVALEQPRSEIPADPKAQAMGPENAPVTIVEFIDYECPYCQRAQMSVDQILKQYDGKIRFIHRDYPLSNHSRAIPAARAARCAAEQGRFWDYHRGLLLQPTAYDDADLKSRAAALKLDTAAFGSCVASDRHDADIRRSAADGEKLGVEATPTFYVNGRKLMGASTPEQFRELIEPELQKAR